MDTTRITYRALCGAAVISLTLWFSGATRAQEHHPPATQESRGLQDHRQMLNYVGSGVIQGEYEGTLYCLRHDFSGSEADKAICQKEGHHEHALVMKQGYVHPLYGVNQEVHTQIHSNEMHGKQVTVTGKFYPVTNAILVNEVTPK